jgi:hypothetical protein
MCGIVGLFLKDYKLAPELGAYLAAMLGTLCDRGPDSGGFAVYRDAMPEPVNTPEIRIPCPEDRKFKVVQEVKDRLDEETAAPVVLQELLATLYQRNGFRGNRDAYYDPRNSFLSEVLDRRRGIPLTLGIVMLEVGWRLGLPLEGVNFPGHFLVRYAGEAVQLLVDNPDAGIAELRKAIKGPDFPTGAYIYGREGIKEAYETGRGRVVMRARAQIEERETSNRSQIVVTEIPYQVN